MKKNLSLVMFLCVIVLVALFAAACGAGRGTADSPAAAEAGSEDEQGTGESAAPDGDFNDISVDVDLTLLSSTMVFAEVFNMMTSPEDYLGKTIRARGNYAPQYFEGTDQYYHYVTVDDAAACCQQGLEFILNDDRTYPEDYPKHMAEIEVVGVFTSYYELGGDVYYLDVDEIREV